MRTLLFTALTASFAACAAFLSSANANELYQAPPPGTHTRWVSPENPTGAKGAGGKVNKGAKGMAFITIQPGETAVLADIQGAGIIHRMWLSGTIPRNPEQRRLVRLEMYWDGAKRPAVAVPIGDFSGDGLGLQVLFESALFASPEGRSYNFTIPMPYRKGAKVLLVNESKAHALVWYDINYTEVAKHDSDVLYFHAAWRREPKTELGKDFEVLPRVQGKGRYLGANIGVIGSPENRGTWFGEGEVKVFLDGDTTLPIRSTRSSRRWSRGVGGVDMLEVSACGGWLRVNGPLPRGELQTAASRLEEAVEARGFVRVWREHHALPRAVVGNRVG